MLDHHPDTKWPWWPGRPCYHLDILAPKSAGGHVTHPDAKLETSWRLDHHPDFSLYGGVVCAVKLVDHEVLSSNPAAVQIYHYYPSRRLNLIFFNVNQSAFYFIYVSWHLCCLSPHCRAQPTYKGMHSIKNVDKQETAVFNVLPHINVLSPVYPTPMYKLWAECRWS